MENQYRQRARNPNHCNSNTVVPSVDDGFDVICTCTYFELETLVTSIYFYIRFLVVRFEAQGFSQSSISWVPCLPWTYQYGRACRATWQIPSWSWFWARYEYWHRKDDLWMCTGELVAQYMKGIIQPHWAHFCFAYVLQLCRPCPASHTPRARKHCDKKYISVPAFRCITACDSELPCERSVI